MRIVWYLIVFILFISSNLYSQDLQFYREDLTFKIKDNYFYVDGIYNFCNNGKKEIEQVLFYPFPIDSIYGVVDSIKAFDINTKEIIIISKSTEQGFYFKIKLQPYGVGNYKISYRQQLLENKAEYILVTTKKWNKPFDNAQYKLITPVDLKITSISYRPDSAKQVNNNMFYYWNKKDFMPDRNMLFYFSN